MADGAKELFDSKRAHSPNSRNVSPGSASPDRKSGSTVNCDKIPSAISEPQISKVASEKDKRRISVFALKTDQTGNTIMEELNKKDGSDNGNDQIIIREIDMIDDTVAMGKRHSFRNAVERAAEPKEHAHTRVVRIDASRPSEERSEEFIDGILPQSQSAGESMREHVTTYCSFGYFTS